MIGKILASFIPFLGVLAPVCSAKGGEGVSVFASMMNSHAYKLKEGEEKQVLSPENLHFDEAFRVMSFNVCMDEDKAHLWQKRRDLVASMIRFHRADLVGLQESSPAQIEDLRKSLKEFESYGEISNAIFFRKSRFKLLKSGCFYNPTSQFTKGTIWVKLFDQKMGQEFFFFTTHFDYFSQDCRNESAELLKKEVAKIAGKSSFVITGDFNLFPNLGGEETYAKLIESFQDAQKLTQFPHHGPTGTWSGFKEAGQPGIKPDFIFVSPRINVYLHGVLSDTFDGRFPSDHLPVVADLAFQ